MIPERFRSNSYPLVRGNTDRVTSIVDKGNGKFVIQTVNDFVTLKKINLTVYPSGKSHAKIKIDRNYCAPETVQYWYDCEGKEIRCDKESDERKLFNQLP